MSFRERRRAVTVYVIRHSNTESGYTYDYPVLWEPERHFIDAAISMAEQDADLDSPIHRDTRLTLRRYSFIGVTPCRTLWYS